jgi:hypothetical protein
MRTSAGGDHAWGGRRALQENCTTTIYKAWVRGYQGIEEEDVDCQIMSADVKAHELYYALGYTIQPSMLYR